MNVSAYMCKCGCVCGTHCCLFISKYVVPQMAAPLWPDSI